MKKTLTLLLYLALFAQFSGTVQAQDGGRVGKTEDDQKRNAALLQGFDYSKYVELITGYTGQDRQRISLVEHRHAVRTRVGPRGNYKAAVVERADGALVLATCRRTAKDPSVFAFHIYQSTDQGQTWEEIGKTPIIGKEPCLAAIPGGQIVLTAQNMGKPTAMTLARSDDGGRTWATSDLPGPDYPRNLIVEPDGSLLMIRAKKPGWNPSVVDASSNMNLGRSRDGGKTWTFSEGLIDWRETKFGEISSLRLKDGRLLAALRTQIPGAPVGEGFETTVLTESSDNGVHWTKPRPMTGTAEVQVNLMQLKDGRLLATYTHYHLPWGVYAVLSRDEGKTWDMEHPVELALSGGISVGWPVTIQLADSSLLTCYAAETYWREPANTFVTEVVRWQLP